MRYKNIVLSFIVLLFCTHARATIIQETTDFNNGSSFGFTAFNIGALSEGMTSVLGSLSGSCSIDCNSNRDDDGQDSFLIEIESGFQLSSIFLSALGSGPTGFRYSFAIRNEINTINIFEPFITIGTTTSNLLTSVLDSGVYSVSVFAQSAAVDGNFDLDYTLDFNVISTAAIPNNSTNVPAPASFGLLLLSGLGLMARRRTNKQSSIS